MQRSSSHKTAFFLIACLLLSACQKDQNKRAVVIGIDGVQWEKIQALETPNFDRLNYTKAYSGGIRGSQKEQVTSSGSSWTTLLTGVWSDKHKITSNLMFGQQAEFGTFLSRARLDQAGIRVGAVINWGNPFLFYYPYEIPLMDHFRYFPNNDERVTSATSEAIANDLVDVLFVHINEPDRVGHADGFGEEYNAAILKADEQLGAILDAVEQRKATHPEEDWLVMTVTDHGREVDTGFNHGAQTTSEKTVYIGISSDAAVNEEFTSPTIMLPYDEFDGLYSFPGQTAVAVTVLRHLKVSEKTFSDLEGTPLIGPLGVRKLFAEHLPESEKIQLSWVNSADASNITTITRNGEVIAELANQSGSHLSIFVDDVSDVDVASIDYVVTTNAIDSYFRIDKLPAVSDALVSLSLNRATCKAPYSNMKRFNSAGSQRLTLFPKP